MLCREPNDPFLEEKTIWIADLSNGERIYQDDGRGEPESAWLRLREYLQKEKLRITAFELRFRSNSVRIPINGRGCLFSKAVGKDWGSELQDNFYVVGDFVSVDNIYCRWLRVPELIEFNTNLKNVADCKPEQVVFFNVEEPNVAC